MHKKLKEISGWPRRKKILLFVLVFSLAILCLVVFWFGKQSHWLKVDYEKQSQLNAQQDKFEELFFYIQTAESSVRGFAGSGSEKFVYNFDSIIDSINLKKLELIKLQNQENPGLSDQKFNEFSELVRQKTEFMLQVKVLCEQGDCEAALKLIATERGVRLTDSIFKFNFDTNLSLQNSLKKSKTAFAKASRRNSNVAYSGITASILLIILVFYFLLREIRVGNRLRNDLRVQKNNLDTTLNSIGEGIITTNREGKIVFMNPAAEQLTGWLNMEVKNQAVQTVYNVVNEETGMPFESIIDRIIREGNTVELENNTILKTRNDRKLIISNNGSPLRDSGGNVSGAVLVFKDITEKKKSEIELKESEKKYRDLFEQASDAILVYSFDGAIHEFNNIICSISGYTREEFSRLRLDDILVGELVVSTEKYEAILAGKAVTLNRQFKRKDGVILDMEVRAKILNDGNVLAFGRDVTERNRQEREIKRAIERYEILSKATSDTIWDWNIKKDSIRYNEGIKNMFGYQLEEVETIVDWWKNNLHPEDGPKINRILNQAFESGAETIQMEYRYRCADKSYKYIFDRAFVVYDESGNPVRMIGAMQDITREKLHERDVAMAIIETQENERRELGMELHDNVNQLLSATLLYLGMAKRANKDGPELTGMLDECVKYINEANSDIRKLSHRLTPYSKERISLKEIIEWVTEPLQATNRYAIDLQVDELNNDELTDEIQTTIYRIIQEQVNNIVKHASADKVEINVKLRDNNLVLQINDNGKGFNPETVKSGIGLENIRRRTEIFFGSFSLKSSPGKGCSLTVELPVNKK